MEPFTVDHFERYARLLVYDDGERRPLEGWQVELVADLLAGYKRNLWVVPEGNGKSTLVSLIALYGADYADSPWIPVGAAAAIQARIIYQQAAGFVRRTPGMAERFDCLDGIKHIRSQRNPGPGIQIYAHDPNTGDGVIPYPWALLDELHRHPDMRLWDLWAGKLRKRDGQVLGITTAGEPETPFENMRDQIRTRAKKRRREGAYLRAEAPGEVLHEWMVQKDEDCSDMEAVKEANPLSSLTPTTLAEDFALATDLGEWKRRKCNRPVRNTESAISDKEWDDALLEGFEAPDDAEVVLGMDVAFKFDTTAIVPLFREPRWRVLLPPAVIVPPRDGTSIHPDEIKDALLGMADRYRVEALTMDMSRAQDIAAWVEDTLGWTVFDADQSRMTAHVNAYLAFMEGLRNGTLKHTGDRELRAHCLNAIVRRLPGGDYRFDRPSPSRSSSAGRGLRAQDQRVVDALTAAAMVVELSTRDLEPARSVYEDRRLVGA